MEAFNTSSEDKTYIKVNKKPLYTSSEDKTYIKVNKKQWKIHK